MYMEVNTYPHLVNAGISGNPERLTSEKLLEQAWALVAPYLENAKQETKNRYRDFAGSSRASNGIRKIVPASRDGRIELLFITRARSMRWNQSRCPIPGR
jgi:glucose-6-phosphate 1-dehydrogenase